MEKSSKMTDSMNLTAHYTNNPKVSKPVRVAVSAPQSLPTQHVFDTKDADKRLSRLNADIYKDSKHSKNEPIKKFAKVFGAIILLILGVRGIKHITTIFKKS